MLLNITANYSNYSKLRRSNSYQLPEATQVKLLPITRSYAGQTLTNYPKLRRPNSC